MLVPSLTGNPDDDASAESSPSWNGSPDAATT